LLGGKVLHLITVVVVVVQANWAILMAADSVAMVLQHFLFGVLQLLPGKMSAEPDFMLVVVAVATIPVLQDPAEMVVVGQETLPLQAQAAQLTRVAVAVERLPVLLALEVRELLL
jgi:hypothetical protein